MAEDQFGFDPELNVTQVDNPFWDSTDAAHPAWWRGNDQGVAAVIKIINEILDGKRTGEGRYGSAELTKLHNRLLKLVL